jgi:pyochelin synthetase
MNVTTLISEFADRGISLWADGESVRYRAPRGAMTPELLDALRADKALVLEYLRRSTALSGPDAPVWKDEPEAREEPFALTDVQSAYLLGRGDMFAYGGVPCHIYLEFPLPADTDTDPVRLTEAWGRLLVRHDMLRAVISADGVQRVLAKAPASCSLHVTDLRGAVPDDRGAVPDDSAAEIDRIRADLSHRMHPLGQEPLYEVRLSLTDDEALLHLSVDFTAFDYASIQLLLAELDLLYREPDHELPPLRATFRDYLAALGRLSTGEAYERDRAYWLDRLDQIPGAPALPLREPGTENGPGSCPARFTRLSMVLHEAQWRSLKERAARHGVTASGAVLAVYAEVIGRWSGTPRFGLNLTLLNRRPLHQQVDMVVGDFTSVSILTVDPEGAPTFADRARGLGMRLFEDLDHGLYTGVELLREMARARGREAALLPVVFTSGIGVAARAAAAAGGTAPRPSRGISQTPQVWIDCQVGDQSGDLDVNWDIRDNVLPDGLAATMFEAFAAALRHLADDADDADDDAYWTSRDPVGLPHEQAERRRAVNATGRSAPDVLLHEPLVRRALAEPGRVAIIDVRGPVTYGEWLGRAAAVSSALEAAGCQPGEPVAILLPKGRDQLVAVLGTLMAAGAYMPVDVDQPLNRRNAILSAAGVRFALLDNQYLDNQYLDNQYLDNQLPDGIVSLVLNTLPDAPAPDGMPRRRVGTESLAYVIHTSGSTGLPKGVMISHRAAANTVDDVNARFAVGSADRVLGLAALGFDLSVYDIFGPPAAGAAIVLPDPVRRGDPSHWADLVVRHAVTLWNSVPAQMQMLADYLEHEPSAAKATGLRLAMLSGDWIPLALPDQVRRLLPAADLISLGGATEAAIWSILHPIREVLPEWRSIPYGTPMANQRFYVLDAALRDCPDLVPGDLYIAGTGLADGYLNDPGRGAAAFPTRPATGERLYRTGDLGRYLPNSEIEFLGRRDQQVKIRGHRIELGEVESVLARYPAVGSAVAVVDGEAAMERRLAAFVEPAAVDEQSARAAAMRAADLVRTLTEAAAEVTEPALPDRAALTEYTRRLDELMLTGFIRALTAVGLFGGESDRHSFEEIVERTGTAPEHTGLLRRALRAIERHGRVRQDQEAGTWSAPDLTACDDLDESWSAFDQARPADICPDRLAGYFRASAEAVPQLLRGEVEATHIFFSEGSNAIARAWYADNAAARRMNALLSTVVASIAAGHADGRPLRVLEVGGGIGTATEVILPALADIPVDYRFTDVSHYFLSAARERFGARPGMRFGLFDMNRDVREQGYAANSFDVVVSSGALNNARDTAAVLERLRGLLTAEGWLVVLDLSREHAEVTATHAFMMEDPQDLRRDLDTVFIDREQWTELLALAGGQAVLCLPEPDHDLSLLGQHVFAACFKTDRAAVTPQELTDWVRTRLPEYMVPGTVQLVDAIPLTGNGKVDRRKLAGWTARATASGEAAAPGSDAPKDDLERRVAIHWSAVLGGGPVGRDQDFFESGGDSLLAARLVGSMRSQVPEAEAIGFDDLLRGMLSAPRLSAVADLIRTAAQQDAAQRDAAQRDAAHAGKGPSAGSAASKAPASALVGLGGSGQGPVRVLVHEGLGTLAPLRALARELSAHGPVAGFAVPNAESYLALPADTIIEELAAGYARELLAAGHQRMEIIGYCSGGLIATEVARALAEAGAPPERLTVVSSYRIPYRIDEELMTQYAFTRTMGGDPGELGWPADEQAVNRSLIAVLAETPGRIPAGALAGDHGDPGLTESASAFARLANADQEQRLRQLFTALAELNPGLGSPRNVSALYRVFRHTVDSVTRYDPPPYAGDITFLRPRRPTHFIPGEHQDMTAFWADLCLGEISIAEVPGDHFGCIQRPHVRRLSETIAGKQTAGMSATAARGAGS